jgi:small-conductance mechanosensitive channel
LVNLVNFFKKFITILVFLILLTFGVAYAFDQLIAQPTGLSTLIVEAVRTVIVVVFGLITILFVQRSKSLISRSVGVHPATVFRFFMILVTVIVVFFAVMQIFQVESTTLLLGGGIVSIVLGLVISTFVGNILAGTLVLLTNPFREGDLIVVNNIPGKVFEISSFVTRIRNDFGGEMVIPNSAIVQGGVIVTKFPSQETSLPSRIPYSVGDRVYTNQMNAEGTVKEITPFQTKILLDSEKEITILNSSILTGAVVVAKITKHTSSTH